MILGPSNVHLFIIWTEFNPICITTIEINNIKSVKMPFLSCTPIHIDYKQWSLIDILNSRPRLRLFQTKIFTSIYVFRSLSCAKVAVETKKNQRTLSIFKQILLSCSLCLFSVFVALQEDKTFYVFVQNSKICSADSKRLLNISEQKRKVFLSVFCLDYI